MNNVRNINNVLQADHFQGEQLASVLKLNSAFTAVRDFIQTAGRKNKLENVRSRF